MTVSQAGKSAKFSKTLHLRCSRRATRPPRRVAGPHRARRGSRCRSGRGAWRDGARAEPRQREGDRVDDDRRALASPGAPWAAGAATVAGRTVRPPAGATSVRVGHLRAARRLRRADPRVREASLLDRASHRRPHPRQRAGRCGHGWQQRQQRQRHHGGQQQPSRLRHAGAALAVEPRPDDRHPGCGRHRADDRRLSDLPRRQPLEPRTSRSCRSTRARPRGCRAWAGNSAPRLRLRGRDYGIPFMVVPGTQPKVPITFDQPTRATPGPIRSPPMRRSRAAPTARRPARAGRRAGTACSTSSTTRSRRGGAGARLGRDVRSASNALRPEGWTSADAAGLPISPGLVRYDEVVRRGDPPRAALHRPAHAQRLRRPGASLRVQRHDASLPPMGMRVRLKASFDIAGFPARRR